jgi:hypothetical protein
MNLSNEERNQIEKFKTDIKSELSRLSNKINNFIVIEFLSILLTFSFVYNNLTLFASQPIVAWSILSFLIISQIILIQSTRVAIYNWKCNKSALICSEMSDKEFNFKFAQFCKK